MPLQQSKRNSRVSRNGCRTKRNHPPCELHTPILCCLIPKVISMQLALLPLMFSWNE